MGPAKPPVSSKVIAEDDWHLGIVISIMVVDPRQAVSPSSISGPLQNIYSPLLSLKEQLTISPSPKRYKEGMNITFNVPTDKREERLQVYINGRLRRKKRVRKYTNIQTHKHIDTYLAQLFLTYSFWLWHRRLCGRHHTGAR